MSAATLESFLLRSLGLHAARFVESSANGNLSVVVGMDGYTSIQSDGSHEGLVQCEASDLAKLIAILQRAAKTVDIPKAPPGGDHVSPSEAETPFDSFSAAFGALADEASELVSVNAPAGGCLLLLAMGNAVAAIRGADIDEALACLDEVDGYIESIRERLNAIGRGGSQA